MQKTLDLSIKKHETGTIDGAFRTKRSYPAYMNNQEWLAFVTEMEKKHPSAFEEYGAGSGGELKVKGDFPPKMASYGSSSRMIYELSKDICDFRFEYKLPTTVGGIANMDGYLETENTHIFIEAKCREPYGAKPHLIEKRYENLFRYINDDVTNSLHLKVDSLDSKMQVTFSAGDMVLSSFDIKQMICHLLGIATKFLHKPTEKKISFLYLCYNPRLIPLIDELKGIRILDTYDRTCAECEAIDFKGLFASVVRFLSLEMKIGNADADEAEELGRSFEFRLCDQSDYIDKLN